MQNSHPNLIKQKLMLTISVFILLFVLLLFAGCTQDPVKNNTIPTDTQENRIVFNDSYGNRIEISHPASRIIACQIPLVEMLITIGAANKIVGIDQTSFNDTYIRSKLSPGVKNIVGGTVPNIETIITLSPDVIVSAGKTRIKNIDSILPLNLTLVRTDCFVLENLNNDAYVLGELTGNREGAQKYIMFNQKYQALVESRLANITPDEIPTVYGISISRSGGDYVLPGNSSFDDLIKSLHARNINGDLVGSNPQVSREWIFQKDPDIIFIVGFYGFRELGYAYGADSLRSVSDNFKKRTDYRKLKAVQSDKIFIYNVHLTSSPRDVIGLVYFAKAIYPDRFADIDPDTVRKEYAELFGFGDDPGVEWFYPPFDS